MLNLQSGKDFCLKSNQILYDNRQHLTVRTNIPTYKCLESYNYVAVLCQIATTFDSTSLEIETCGMYLSFQQLVGVMYYLQSFHLNRSGTGYTEIYGP